MNNIDILRYYQVLSAIFQPFTKFNKDNWKLAFRIFDYDNNGTIGSVDILKLRMSMETPELERIYTTFTNKSKKASVGGSKKGISPEK